MVYKHKKSKIFTLDCLGGVEVCVARNLKECRYIVEHNFSGAERERRLAIVGNCRGCYIGIEKEGVIHFAVGFVDWDISTVIHEASHLVDMVFDTKGIPAGTESTEIRAYTLQYICSELFRLLGVKHEYRME